MLATRLLILAAQTGANAGGQAAGVWVGSLEELMITLSVSAISGASASLTIFIDAGIDGNQTTDATTWFQIASFAAQTAVTANPATAASGSAPQVLTLGKYVNSTSFGNRIRVRWTLTGTSPTSSFAVKALGKGE